MEIKKIPPITKSYLDSCRGRGKTIHPIPAFELNITLSSRYPIDVKISDMDSLPKTIMLMILPESLHSVGVLHAK